MAEIICDAFVANNAFRNPLMKMVSHVGLITTPNVLEAEDARVFTNEEIVEIAVA